MAQWEAKVSTRLTDASANQIWAFYTDFFGLHKWFNGLSTCYGISGKNGEIGCVRYCAGFSIPSEEDSKGNDNKHNISWSKERLIAIDPVERSFTYEIVDCNIGFKSYVSTVKILDGNGDDDEEERGCGIEWSFVVDPVEGLKLEDLVKKYEVALQSMANNMENALCNS